MAGGAVVCGDGVNAARYALATVGAGACQQWQQQYHGRCCHAQRHQEEQGCLLGLAVPGAGGTRVSVVPGVPGASRPAALHLMKFQQQQQQESAEMNI
eukprot:SAG25_NODE_736_length_5645_cov_2.188965_7_plen_97_part_01